MKQSVPIKKLQRSSKLLFDSLTACTDQFEKIHRLIAFLLFYQSRIQFQYDKKDEYIYFRVMLNHPAQPKLADSIMSLFRFHINDSGGSLGVNFCSSVSGQGNVIQYKIRLMTTRESYAEHPFLRYMGRELEEALSKLPKKSSATIADLPILDAD